MNQQPISPEQQAQPQPQMPYAPQPQQPQMQQQMPYAPQQQPQMQQQMPYAQQPQMQQQMPYAQQPQMQYAPQQQYNGYAPMQPTMAAGTMQKSRITYILLGVFFGGLGVHNFYAGYTGRAIAQLLISVLTLFILSIISSVWALIEVCTVKQDGKGIPFAS